MKHVRHIEVDQPLDSLLAKRAVAKAELAEINKSGPRFFRGLIIALTASLSLWALLFLMLF